MRVFITVRCLSIWMANSLKYAKLSKLWSENIRIGTYAILRMAKDYSV